VIGKVLGLFRPVDQRSWDGDPRTLPKFQSDDVLANFSNPLGNPPLPPREGKFVQLEAEGQPLVGMALPNPRHEQFALIVAGGARPKHAYITAGFSEGGASQSACRLMRSEAVAKRIAALRKTLGTVTAQESQIDADAIIRVLSEIAQRTRLDTTKVRALELIARLLGFFHPEQAGSVWNGNFDELTESQKLRLTNFFAEQNPEVFANADREEALRRHLVEPDKHIIEIIFVEPDGTRSVEETLEVPIWRGSRKKSWHR
jgi:phage terminase small subunit